MHIGMLWFDNSQSRDLKAKLERAISYYKSKHGAQPTTCYVHPQMLVGSKISVDGIRLRESNMILPDHFWLGAEDELEEQPVV